MTALGLGAGVALVMAIVGTSAGLADAQARALTPLSTVGTDVLVTRAAASDSAPPGDTVVEGQAGGPAPAPNGRPVQRVGPGGFRNDATSAEENQALVTDLSKLGNPGEKFTHDFFVSSSGLTFDDEVVDRLDAMDGVDGAVAGLLMVATHQTGTVPKIVAEVQTGGETVEQTLRPPPMTEDERTATQKCLQDKGLGAPDQETNEQPAPAPGSGGGPSRAEFHSGEFEACLPQRFKEQIARFTIPQRTLQQALNPPQTDITSSTYTAGGVDPSHPRAGLVTAAQVTKGSFFTRTATDEVLLAAAYATKVKLDVGGTLDVNGKSFTVVGLVEPAVEGHAADLYFPLKTLQEISGREGRVNTVLVQTSDAARVESVANSIREALPDAQVVTTESLAAQVTGSLKDTKKLADRFGGVLALLVLGAAFTFAALLTIGSVGKRVREIGTLRAIGWPRRLVMRQILLETIGISVVGAVLGVGLGLAAGALIGQASPELTATVPIVDNANRLLQSVGASTASGADATRTLRLTVPVDARTLGLGVGLALLGGLMAGAIGASRAARLQPAVALRDVG
ncbi:MAG TPA: ABC transporter permease [Acidimicrobiales bacterium]|nr:ABC transporter permease [Acidimicrobiales bacterium]